MAQGSYPTSVSDPYLQHAMDVIETQYGHKVDYVKKGKDLLKFGHTHVASTTESTIAHLPSGVNTETYLTANSITTVSSSSGSDTSIMTLEGHTVDSNGNFTFVTQSVTLTGQTQVTLGTALARATRMYTNDSTALVGDIYVYETDTATAGVPDTAAKVHLMIEAGEDQSEHCATTIEDGLYWIVTKYGADFLKKTAGFAEVMLQVKEKGKVFRNRHRRASTNGLPCKHEFKPYFIIKPNSDIRLNVVADSSSTAMSGYIEGILAKVV